MINEIIEINTDNLEPMKPDQGDLWQNRQDFYRETRQIAGNIRVTICVQAFNQINRLKYSLECLQKYTPEDLYELILVDNGSEPEVMELYKSVKHPRVKIIRITKNICSAFPQQFFVPYVNGEYTVMLFDDTYVTKNWLENLLACMDSDRRIGIAVPLSSNTHLYQSINDVNFKSREVIQQFAADYNITDPKKWYQSVSIVTLVPIIRSEIWHTIGVFDTAFYHQYGDDDFAVRIRRAGYKVIICRDTFIYHDHIRDEVDHHKKLESGISGSRIFKEKWNLVPWDDMLYTVPFPSQLSNSLRFTDTKLLCIDPKLGVPIFTIANHIRYLEGSVNRTCAFTSEAKYYVDLATVADETAIGMTENIRQYYSDNFFDIICICKPLNTYPNPLQLIKDVSLLLKSKGVLIFHIENAFNIGSLLHCFGIVSSELTINTGVNLTQNEYNDVLEKNGYCTIIKDAELEFLTAEDVHDFLKPISQVIFEKSGIPFNESALTTIETKKIHYTAVKD